MNPMPNLRSVVRLLALAAPLALGACGDRAAEAHPVAAAPRSLRRAIHAAGAVAFDADATAHVASPVAGRVVEARATIGAKVAAGDVLFALESRELGTAQSELLTHRNAAAALAPGVALAEEAWRRAQDLHAESQGIALAEVRRRAMEHQTALAALRAAENGARAAADALALMGMSPAAIAELAADGVVRPRIELRAPIAGEVVRRNAALGDQVGPDTGALATVVDVARRHVLALVPEAEAGDVEVGGEAMVRPGHGDGRAFAAKIAHAAPMLDETTRTRAVRLTLPPDAPSLQAGMFVEVALYAATPTPPTLAVPASAVQLLERRHVVFVPVAGDAGAFTERPVEVGPAVDGFVPVRGGLREGELVVAEGAFVVKAQATTAAADEEK